MFTNIPYIGDSRQSWLLYWLSLLQWSMWQVSKRQVSRMYFTLLSCHWLLQYSFTCSSTQVFGTASILVCSVASAITRLHLMLDVRIFFSGELSAPHCNFPRVRSISTSPRLPGHSRPLTFIYPSGTPFSVTMVCNAYGWSWYTPALIIFFIIGAACPVILWLITRRYPNTIFNYIKYVAPS